MRREKLLFRLTLPLSALAMVTACGGSLPPPPQISSTTPISDEYIIGPYTGLSIFVWRNPELTTQVTVRPDGRISTPLITDLVVAGKTPTMVAQDIRLQLSQFIKDPIVSVTVTDFEEGGVSSQAVRIVGAIERPASIPFRADLTLLDAIIAVGGLSEFAAGNRARLQRVDRQTGKPVEYRLRLSDLVKRGDTSANVRLLPGDVIIIPQSSF
jgi:polysaccharide export outer membrane protein